MRRRENGEDQQSARQPERWQYEKMSPTITANLEALGDTSDQILDVRDNGLKKKMEKMRQCHKQKNPIWATPLRCRKSQKRGQEERADFNAYSIKIKGRTCTPAACLLVEKNFSAVKVLLPSGLVIYNTCER
jgi:hypothetical protein